MSATRLTEIQVTREFSGPTPVWDDAVVYAIPSGTASLAFPVIGDTDYAVRVRVQDVFGNYSSWSPATTHTTAVGPDGVSVENRTATVTIDDGGITIRDGALTLEDEFGETVMTASGFAGTWADFISDRLYNSRFAAGIDGVLADGRNAALPYWTVSRTGSPVITAYSDADWPGGRYLRFEPSATTDSARISSDLIPVTAGLEYGVTVLNEVNRAAGSLVITGTIEWFDVALSNFAGSVSVSDTVSLTRGLYNSIPIVSRTAPAGAAFAQVKVTIQETGSHNASNRVDVGAVSLQVAPVVVDSQSNLNVQTLQATGNISADSLYVSSGYALIDAGLYAEKLSATLATNPAGMANPGKPVYAIDPDGTPRNIHGIAPGISDGQMVLLINTAAGTANTLTLKHLSASATATTYRFACPANADYVVPSRGGVWLYYTNSLWYVMG